MGKRKELAGKKINNWNVLEFKGINKFGATTWICECSCSKKTIKILTQQALKSVKDCGCSRILDLTNMSFGRWRALYRVDVNENLKTNRKSWMCECSCGTKRIVTETVLLNKSSTSCGCSGNRNEYIFYDKHIEIKLKNKIHSKIDYDDYNEIKDNYWVLSADGYAVSSSGKFKNKRLHRIIMKQNEKDIIIDHANRNKLDNRKENLRIVTRQENSFNQGIRKNNKSGIIGICWWPRDEKWLVQIKHNYNRIFLGYYSDINEAIVVRLKAELKYFGKEFAPQRHLFEKYGVGING